MTSFCQRKKIDLFDKNRKINFLFEFIRLVCKYFFSFPLILKNYTVRSSEFPEKKLGWKSNKIVCTEAENLLNIF